MSQGKTALALMVALALPGAAQALGLGEIHVNSALNEPLAADIDIVGATAEELAGITASIADRETFEHFEVDRPAFLSTVVFKISRDSSGRAILAIRSPDACTEPLLNMLVDLRWRGGELIRQYTVLLDPPSLSSAAPVATALARAPTSYSAPVAGRTAGAKALIQTSRPALEVAPAPAKADAVPDESVARKTVSIGAKATLRGVAWRVGARSDADLKRMMIAIFRANPSAFEGNINRLRRGAVLTIPSPSEVEAISVADARQEIRAQMQAWRASTRRVNPIQLAAAAAVAAPISLPSESPVPAPPAVGGADSAAIAPAGAASAPHAAAESTASPETAALDRRVQVLERRLDELRDRFDREHNALVQAQAQLTVAATAPAVVASAQVNSSRGLRSSIAAILGLAAAGFGIYAWRRRRTLEQLAPVEPMMQDLAPAQEAAQDSVGDVVAASTPARMERRAAGVESHDVPRPAHDVPAAIPLHAKTVERQWADDALARRSHDIATESNEAFNPSDAVDAEALEASYLLHGGGEGIEDTDKFGETAILPATVKPLDDPSAQTTPVETATIVGIPEATLRLRAPEKAALAAKAGVDTTKLDYNLLDLDATIHHVQMPSTLHENVGFKERRTSLVDALKSAVEREPQRLDLRMKLLETYYAAAATNRQGFLDIVQKIAEQRASLNTGDWDKIAWMGRQIASDDNLFAPAAAQSDEEDLANCA